MKVYLFLALILIAITGRAYAQTDYNCMSQCEAQGYLYQLCLRQCSF